MKGLQSTGRYVLPLLPCQVVVLGLAWAELEAHLKDWQKRLAAAFIVLRVVFSVGLNYKVVLPVLQRFDSNYGATMRAAAEELVKRTEGKPNQRVLVEVDIGILSYAGRGRFEIYDGGALATPSLRGLTVRSQIAQSQPAYLVESLASSPDGMGPEFPGLLQQIWECRFRQQSVRVIRPNYYTIIYQVAALPRPYVAHAKRTD